MTRNLGEGATTALPLLSFRSFLLPALLFVPITLAWACAGGGPEPSSGTGSTSADEAEREEVLQAADTVEVSAVGGPEQPAASPLDLRLVLRNPGTETLRLEFSSGQRFDFLLRDAGGEETWRWSEGMSFTQALGSEAVPPEDSLVYEAAVEEGVEPGSYTLVGFVTATGRTLRDSVEIQVGGANRDDLPEPARRGSASPEGTAPVLTARGESGPCRPARCR